MHKRFITALLFCGIALGYVINEQATEASVSLLTEDVSSAKLRIDCGRLSLEPIVTAEGEFVRLEMPGTSPSLEIGAPELPVLRIWIEIPQGFEPEVEVESIQLQRIYLSSLGLPDRVYPRQPPVPKIQGYVPKFVIDFASYKKTEPHFSTYAEIIDIVQMRDHRLALVEIRPVNIIPATGELIIADNMQVSITTPKCDISATQELKLKHHSPYLDALIAPHVINLYSYRIFWVVPADPEIEMIIVTGSSYTSQLTSLVNWKKRKGFKVSLKTSSELGGTTSGIKNYIQTQYNSDDVDFVLLVGDVADVPTWTGGSSGSSSDNPYSELAGTDYIPDCFLGRLSLNSTSQVTEMVNRIVTYEHFGFGTGTSWTLGVTLPASDDATYHTFAENTQRYVAYTHFQPRGYTRIDTIWAYYGGTGTQVMNSINAGVMLCMYTGHGSYNQWAGPAVTQSMVQGLTNTGKYPFIGSFACQTGMFGEYSECFMETWIRQTNKAAIGAIGASDYSYWNEDDVFERRMIDSVFIRQWMFTAGMRLKGLMAVYSSYPSNAEYYFDMYNLFADPSLALWWGAPASLTVTHPATISPGSGSINVNVTSGGSAVNEALVCITNDGSIHTSAYTNSSGNVTLSYSGAIAGETIYITATAYNKIPYEGTITVVASAPDAPTLVSPFNNARLGDGAASTMPTLTWNVPNDPGTVNLHFKVQWDDDADFATPIDSVMSNVSTVGFSPTPPRPDGVGTCSYVVNSQGEGALVNGTTYWWRVKAYNGTVWGDWSTPWSFTVNTSMTQRDWFQTTDDQFATDALTSTQVNSPGSVRLIPGSDVVVQVPSSCADGTYTNGQSYEWYSQWTIPGSGTVTVTKLWFYDNGSLSSGESIKMAMYSTASGNPKIAGSDATLYGTGSAGWISGNVTTPFTITLGSTYWIGVASASGVSYNIYRDQNADCSSYPPNGSAYYSYYATNDYTLNSSVPTSTQSAQYKYMIPGITYVVETLSGTILSTRIDFSSVPGMTSWGYLIFNDDETAGDIKYQMFYDASGTPTIIPDAALPGNSTGFDTSPVSLLGLNPTTYNKLYIKGNLTNSGGTPYLNDWAVSWSAGVVGVQLLVGGDGGADYANWSLGTLAPGAIRIMNASDRVYVKNTGSLPIDIKLQASPISWTYSNASGSGRCVLMALFNGTTVPTVGDFSTIYDTLGTNLRAAGVSPDGKFAGASNDGVNIPAGGGEQLYFYFAAPNPNTTGASQTITITVQALQHLE